MHAILKNGDTIQIEQVICCRSDESGFKVFAAGIATENQNGSLERTVLVYGCSAEQYGVGKQTFIQSEGAVNTHLTNMEWFGNDIRALPKAMWKFLLQLERDRMAIFA